MRHKRKYLFCFLGLGFLLVFSCQKILIKPDPTSSSEQNFEMFWNDVNNGYPYFAEDGIDWKARYDVTRKYITSTTTTDQLYTYITGMLKGFSDGHLSVDYKDQEYENEKGDSEFFQIVRADQSGASLSNNLDPLRYYYYNYFQIENKYVDDGTYKIITSPSVVTSNKLDTICIYGTMDNGNILYVNVTTFLTEYGLADLLQRICTQKPGSLAKGMVLDLRWNGGGDLGIMQDMMGVFVPVGEPNVNYAYYKQKVGPLPESFGTKNFFYVPRNDYQTKYLKPVVVLTNRLTASAAEHATLAMKQIKSYHTKIKIIGDYTFGATSFIVERTLPCGIKYTFVNSKTWDVENVIIERTGVKPDELVYITPQIENDQDEQLERAITVIENDLF